MTGGPWVPGGAERAAAGAFAPGRGAAPRTGPGAGVYAPAEERWARMAWSMITEPGDRVAGALIAELGAAEALRAVTAARPASALRDHPRVGPALDRWRPRARRDEFERTLERGLRAGLAVAVPGDALWPAALGDLGEHAPHALWLRGAGLPLARLTRSVAIVGARASSGYGETVAADLAGSLAQRGIAVVSGGAYGIDGQAHRAALGVGGATLAVLAGGADRAYPAGHTELLERVAGSGGVVSEAPPGAAPTRWRFLQRNRLIAALSAATLVVEAGSRSGSINTAGHAAALGRPLGAVPGSILSAASSGCHRLLREYDAACITGVDDVLELIGERPAGGGRPGASADRTGEETRLLDALSTRSPRAPAEVAARAGLDPERTLALLGLLELVGDAARGADGRWRRAAAA